MISIYLDSDESGECGAECDYKSWQKSFYIASLTEFLSAIFFLATAFFVVKDWDKAIKDEAGKDFTTKSRIKYVFNVPYSHTR